MQVPSASPAGTYTLTLNVGTYPALVLAADGFPFLKEPGIAGAPGTLSSVREAMVSGTGDLFSGAAPASTDQLNLAVYPNPSSASTAVRFGLAEAAPVRLVLHDLLGREVAVLADGVRAAGRYTVPVDASSLAPGVYVVRLGAGPTVVIRRLTVAR